MQMPKHCTNWSANFNKRLCNLNCVKNIMRITFISFKTYKSSSELLTIMRETKRCNRGMILMKLAQPLLIKTIPDINITI